MSIKPERGLVVGARYRLEEVLGEGGMAVVWAAVHTETDRKVALKLVRPEFVTDQQVRELFVSEARVAARVGKSDHIVDVLDAGVDPELEVPFIAMERLVGSGLDARIRSGPIPAALAADLLEQLAEALDQAHGAGVFHRDLKPQNLFLTTDRKGRPLLKVLDFGIAKLSETTAQSATQIGTPAYAAPEQLGESWRSIAKQRGQTIAAAVSATTDVWALGLVVFEMLTGTKPGAFWGAKTLAELPVKVVLEPLPVTATRADAARLPPGFDPWIARCLALDATQRWPSAGEAVAAIVPALRGTPRTVTAATPQRAAIVATPPPQPTPFAPPAPTAPQGPPEAPAPSGPPIGTAPPGRWPAPPSYAGPMGVAPMAGPDPRLLAWVTHRRAELRAPGDPRPFLAAAVVYLPRMEQVAREARIAQPGSLTTIAEIVTSDAMRKAMNEDRMVVAMIQTARLQHRGAVRSKRSSGGLVDGMSRGLKALDALIAAPSSGILGDPHFEAQFEVWAPGHYDAQAAFPVSLRQALVTMGFHGIVERFPGAVLVTVFNVTRFEPTELDRLLDVCGRILAAIP